MKKVKISLKINDYKLNTTGFINNNILSFNDKDELKTNIIYDFNTDILIRDNSEITIKILFNEKEDNVEYILKKENATFKNKFTNLELIKKDNTLIINYRIEETDFILKLSYKED